MSPSNDYTAVACSGNPKISGHFVGPNN